MASKEWLNESLADGKSRVDSEPGIESIEKSTAVEEFRDEENEHELSRGLNASRKGMLCGWNDDWCLSWKVPDGSSFPVRYDPELHMDSYEGKPAALVSVSSARRVLKNASYEDDDGMATEEGWGNSILSSVQRSRWKNFDRNK